jgi:hypothetical protein
VKTDSKGHARSYLTGGEYQPRVRIQKRLATKGECYRQQGLPIDEKSSASLSEDPKMAASKLQGLMHFAGEMTHHQG